MNPTKPKSYITRFIIYTYVLFLLLLLSFGGIAKVLLHGTPLAMRFLIAITAWTSTYVFLLMFKKLYPNRTVKEFYIHAFKEKINSRLLVTTIVIQMIIFAFSVFMVYFQNGFGTINLLDFSFSTIISGLFFTLIQGATGEETGWRGYLLPAVEKKIGIVKASVIVSLIWSFWHAPIWFLDSGYLGIELVQYIAVFVICITSLGFIIGICYHWCHNLLIPIALHFTFNFLGVMFKGDLIELVTWYAVFYFIVAVGFYLWHRIMLKKSQKIAASMPENDPLVSAKNVFDTDNYFQVRK